MATIVVPFRPNGKTRLSGNDSLARAMLADVLAACEPVARTIVADAEGGQGLAVEEALAGLEGPVAIVNADLPCATTEDVEALLNATPADGLALVEAPDGTTNALALARPDLFQPLYGPGSAERFRAAAPSRALTIPNLADDVDTPEDLTRLGDRLGPHTRAALP